MDRIPLIQVRLHDPNARRNGTAEHLRYDAYINLLSIDTVEPDLVYETGGTLIHTAENVYISPLAIDEFVAHYGEVLAGLPMPKEQR